MTLLFRRQLNQIGFINADLGDYWRKLFMGGFGKAVLIFCSDGAYPHGPVFGGRGIGRMALACQASLPVVRWKGLPADGADPPPADSLFTEEAGGGNKHLRDAQDIRTRLLDLVKKKGRVLVLFGDGFEKPAPDRLPGFKPPGIEPDPVSPAIGLVKQAQGEFLETQDAHPAVADGTGGQQLNGIGQAPVGFAQGVEENAPGQALQGRLNHFPRDDQARCRVPMKGANQFQVLAEGKGRAFGIPAPDGPQVLAYGNDRI